jgi:hypothetical protein
LVRRRIPMPPSGIRRACHTEFRSIRDVDRVPKSLFGAN